MGQPNDNTLLEMLDVEDSASIQITQKTKTPFADTPQMLAAKEAEQNKERGVSVLKNNS